MGNFILKYKYLIAFGIFIVHYFFKTYALGVNGLWFDECYSVNMGSSSIDEILNSTQTSDPNPPLYLILLHYWMVVFGDSEYGVRLLSVIASSLSASVLFLFCVRFLNWQTSIFASIMFFTSNDLYYYAQEARAFSLVILFVILSNYFYLSIFKNPKIWKAFFLGACNAIIFYLHIIATFNMVAQLLCLPFILVSLQKSNAIKDNPSFSFNVSVAKKKLLCYLVSIVVFVISLQPWADRLVKMMDNEGKTWWVGKPNFDDFKYAIYELFNFENIFWIYFISFVSFLLLLVLFKKLREQLVNWKIIGFIIVSGPILIYLVYLAAGFTPIFLKRYVLFTFIGFILLYSYTFSIIKINFISKLVLFLILGAFTFENLAFPRASFFEYEKAMVFLKQVQKPDVFISTNQPDLFSYYYDRNIFRMRPDSIKRQTLLTKGICSFNSFEADWVWKNNLEKYKEIYYTCSFHMYDPENYIGKLLERNFVLTNDITRFKGIYIRHYINPNYKKDGEVNNSELFLFNNKKFRLKAANDKFVCVDGYRNDLLVANRDTCGAWETFSMRSLGHSQIAINSYADKYFSAELGGGAEITAIRSQIGPWETFKVLYLGNDLVALKADNGKYLSLDKKSLQLFANGNSIEKNEKFKIIKE